MGHLSEQRKRMKASISDHLALREQAWDEYFYHIRCSEFSSNIDDKYKSLEKAKKASTEAQYQDGIINSYYSHAKVREKIQTIKAVTRSGKYGGIQG